MRLNRVYIIPKGKAKIRPPYSGITCVCNGPWIPMPPMLTVTFGPQGFRCQGCGGIDFGLPMGFNYIIGGK